MNKMQKRIIVAGALVIILMGLIPPWTYTFNYKSVQRTKPAGYALIIAPPPPEKLHMAAGVELDFIRLLVQWVITGIAMGVGFALAHTKFQKSSE